MCSRENRYLGLATLYMEQLSFNIIGYEIVTVKLDVVTLQIQFASVSKFKITIDIVWLVDNVLLIIHGFTNLKFLFEKRT